jgi:hypothetical protein
MNELSPAQLQAIADATFRKTADISLKHAKLNLPYVKKTVADLEIENQFPAAIVVSGGPSIHLKDPLTRLKKATFRGPIVSCDGALGNCLRHGIVPDFVVSVDPHPDRIVRWFGDTKLAQRKPDDYFRNQDLDETVARNERKANDELIGLVNKNGKKIKAILATSVTPDITERCLESGMEIYWWNPIFDDYDAPGSLTRQLYDLNKCPGLVTGGNVGASSFSFAYAVLRKKVIGLLGMDFSYAPGTPLSKTQYYEHIKEIYPDDPAKAYIEIFNPYLNQTWFTDPAYYWYRQSFLQLAENIEDDVAVHNCSEGGILFGQRIHFTPFDQFLTKFQGAAPEAVSARG